MVAIAPVPHDSRGLLRHGGRPWSSLLLDCLSLRLIVLPHTPTGGGNTIRRALSQAFFRRLFPAAIHLLGQYPLLDIYRLSLFQDSCTSSGAVPSLKDFRHLLIALCSWTFLNRVSLVAFLINRFRHGFFWAIFLISSSGFTFGFASR